MPKGTKAIKVTDLRGGKPWLKKVGIPAYNLESREKNKTFLVVCEGQTEELYFKAFPVITAKIKSVPLGCSKSRLVECAASMVEDEVYDEVWCVFDLDYKGDINGQFEDFNNAIQRAQDLGFKCAYSNDAFELWFVLHYQYLDQQQFRYYYYEILSQHWSINYERNGKSRDFCLKNYSRLLNEANASQASAIERAKRLYEMHKEKPYHQQNPVTKVYELVEKLNEHIRR